MKHNDNHTRLAELDLCDASARYDFDAGVLGQTHADQVIWLRLLYQARLQDKPLSEVWSTAWQLAFGSLPSADSWQQEAGYALGLSVAAQVQGDMGQQLPYHCAAHAGDTLILMGALLRAWRGWSLVERTQRDLQVLQGEIDLTHTAKLPEWDSTQALLCLLSALAHDWGHEGASRVKRQERLEEKALRLLVQSILRWGQTHSHVTTHTAARSTGLVDTQSLAHSHQQSRSVLAKDARLDDLLGVHWQQTLAQRFNATDPAQWAAVWAQYEREARVRPVDEGRAVKHAKGHFASVGCDALLNAFMIEADIGSSLLPAHGDYLNQRVLEEMTVGGRTKAKRGLSNAKVNKGKPAHVNRAEIHKINRARLAFLLGVRVCTPMAWQLGLPQLRQATLSLLKPQDMSLLNYAELLARQTLFAKLRAHELQALAQIAIKMKLKKGQTLVKQGDSTEALYVVLTGRAVVQTRDKEGREIILNQVVANEYIGELHVVDGTPHSADVIAMTQMDVLRLERKALLACMMSNPQLSLSMLSGLANRLRISDERVRSLAYQNTTERLIQAIGKFPDQPLSATYLAKSVGCSRETATRLLADLQSKGRVSHTKAGWQVHEV